VNGEQQDAPLNSFRILFYAAAVYNFGWGVAAIFFPTAILRAVHVSVDHVSFFQCIGMLVFVYAFAYWLIARNPVRYAPLVWVGLLGKTLGPIGCVWAAATGDLPWTFFYISILNDVIWWPAFWIFALKYAREI